MDERQNRDDLVKRVMEQTSKNERRELSSKEVERIVKDVQKNVMPKVYEDRN